jgi:ubiquinone/menaquinone biosynthesis C-methylase UbiE
VEFTSLALAYIAAFSRSTFQNVSDHAADPKVSEIHLALSSIESLPFPDQSSTMICTLSSIESERNSHPCLLQEIAIFSRSMVVNVLHILAHGKKDGFAAADDKT